MRRLNLAVTFYFQQPVLPSRAAHLICNELRPIAQRAMDGSRRAEHRGVVHFRTILLLWLAVRAMRPGLIYLARRPQSAETRALHPQRPEDNLPHQLFP